MVSCIIAPIASPQLVKKQQQQQKTKMIPDKKNQINDTLKSVNQRED